MLHLGISHRTEFTRPITSPPNVKVEEKGSGGGGLRQQYQKRAIRDGQLDTLDRHLQVDARPANRGINLPPLAHKYVHKRTDRRIVLYR